MRAWAAAGVVAVLSAAGAILAPGCGGGSSCAAGREGCSCAPSGLCDTGLTCASKVCVNVPMQDAGGAGAGGADAGNPMDAGASTSCPHAEAACRRYADCAPFTLTARYGDLDTCIARLQLACEDAFKVPASGLTPETSAACAAAYATASCDDFFYGKVGACHFTGARQDGEVCAFNEECASGFCIPQLTCGICAALLPAGESCGANAECQPGLVCAGAHCLAPSAPGAACDAQQPCGYGYYCHAGSCAAAQETPGAACQEAGSCDGDKGLWCNTAAGVCQTIGSAAPGEACIDGSGDEVVCAGSACVPTDPTVPNDGLCNGYVADGQLCGAGINKNVGCRWPEVCSRGRCVLPSAAICQ
jgi:hypothetical protein